MPEDAKVPSITNPLWIISLILGICQLTLGAATTLTSGWIQGVFAIFMVIYTSSVTAGFFYLLNSRAHVFYSPREYKGGATVEQYSKAVARAQYQAKSQAQVVSTSTDLAFASLEKSLTAAHADDHLIRNVLSSARSEVRRSTVTVNLSTFDKSLGEVTMPVTDDQPVIDFTNSIYFLLPTTVPAFTYGETWLLRRRSDGHIFTEMGTPWAMRNGRKSDERPLAEVGIRGGSEYDVVPGKLWTP